jgi:hypothetical protein
MKLFEIKNRFSGAVLFSLETENLKLAIETAVKAGADLRGADLRGADLRDTYLRGADLRGADLRGADLRGADLCGADLCGADLCGAKIRADITIQQEPIQISGLVWYVTIWDRHMQIGCEFHSHDSWKTFSDDQIGMMDNKTARKFWDEHKTSLLALCDTHAKKVT